MPLIERAGSQSAGDGVVSRTRHPARFIVVAFLLAILVGTLLLSLPFAAHGAGATDPLTALFTATSAVCVTGLVVVDTATYWTGFGEGVILLLIQAGGFGIMSLASLLALFAYRNLGLWSRIVAQTETNTLTLGEVRRVLIGVAFFSLVFEAIAASVLTARLALTYDVPWWEALYQGVFHSVSAFNNAGFALYQDNLIPFVTDVPFTLTIALAVIVGGIGFPVLAELRRRPFAPRRWSLHTKITLLMTAVLIIGGTVMVATLEWTNPDTLGGLPRPYRLLASFFQGISPRTAGFNTLDYAAMNEPTWLGTMVLMFIGGGSAATAGGVKVTTIAILAMMVWAETRGDTHVNLMHRRIAGPAQRQALSIVLVGICAVIAGTFILSATGGHALGRSMFESFSAFGTVGLSLGITDEVTTLGRVTLVVLMFAGRVGPITLGAALALRETHRRYRFPEERPIVG